MRSVAGIALLLAASFAGVAVTSHHALAQDSGFVAWPRELASRAPALADGITREFGQRPSTIAFDGRDTLRVVFWNPTVWHDDMDSKVIPQKSLPKISAATVAVAAYVWKAFAREAEVRMIRVAFVRVVHDNKYMRSNDLVPAQEVNGLFSPKMIEAGTSPLLAIALREGGAWDAATQRRIDSIKWGPEQGRSERLSLTAGVQREIGQVAVSVTSKEADTIDVVVQNPSFWRKDDTLQALPELTLPTAREAANRAAAYLWERQARATGVNVIRVEFRREWRSIVGNTWLQRPAQQVIYQFTRRQLESGQLGTALMTIIQRSGKRDW